MNSAARFEWLVVSLMILGLQVSARAQSKDKPKLAELEQVGDMLTVDGFWEPDNPTKQNELVPTAVHIQCFRHGGKEANLTKTEAFCIVSTATTASGCSLGGRSSIWQG